MLGAGPSYTPDQKTDANYFAGLNQALLRQIPDDARRILDVGCASGRLGHALKTLRADRTVFGIERIGPAAASARQILDAVYEIDITRETPPIEAGSLDCIVLSDVLECIYDPVDVLRRLSVLLHPAGKFICSIPNIHHFSTLASILSGDFQYQPEGLLDRDHIRFFALANVQKMFLDAGCLPRFEESVRTAVPDGLMQAFLPACEFLHLNPAMFEDSLQTYQIICSATPLLQPPPSGKGITFISAVNNEREFTNNLRASPIFRSGRHELITVVGAKSAAEALETGLAHSKADHDFVVLVHQDVYLPEGWDDRMLAGITHAERDIGDWGVAGVFGVVAGDAGVFERAGVVLDRRTLLSTPHRLPARATSLDELLLVFPRAVISQLALSKTLGFHFYGSDACCASVKLNKAAIIIDAPCLHHSQNRGLDEAFFASARAFMVQRPDVLPYATTCVSLSERGEIS